VRWVLVLLSIGVMVSAFLQLATAATELKRPDVKDSAKARRVMNLTVLGAFLMIVAGWEGTIGGSWRGFGLAMAAAWIVWLVQRYHVSR
jgi:hypothetical protein